MKRWIVLAALAAGLGGMPPFTAGAEPQREGWADRAGREEPRREFEGEGRVLEFLEARLPQMAKELRAIREENPGAYRERLEAIGRKIREYQALKREAPELAEAMLQSHQLEQEAEMLAARIAAGRIGDDREEAVARLRDILGKVFDLRLQPTERELHALEKETERIRARLAHRRAAKDQIVERRIKKLLSETDDALGWW